MKSNDFDPNFSHFPFGDPCDLFFSVGGFPIGYKNVVISGNKIYFRMMRGSIRTGDWIPAIDVDEKRFNNFHRSLKNLHVAEWGDEEYVAEGVCDGTQWNIEFKGLKIHGSNDFPYEWDYFLRAVSKLVGKNLWESCEETSFE